MAPDATHYYGADSQQVIDCYIASPATASSPTVIMLNAAGFGPASTSGLTTNANTLRNLGCAVFVVGYRGDIAPTSSPFTAGTVGPGALPAFPMAVDDVVAGALWVKANAATYFGDTTKLHFVAGSAGGTLAGLATADLLDLGYDVASCQLMSSNTDWWSAIAFYRDVIANPTTPYNAAWIATIAATGGNTAGGHLTNIANAYGTFHSNNAPPGANGVGSLERNIDTNLWPESYFQQFSVAGRASRNASRCWWQVYNSSIEEIPLQQPYYLVDALTQVGTEASLTILPGNKHGWNNWNACYQGMSRFIRLAQTH